MGSSAIQLHELFNSEKLTRYSYPFNSKGFPANGVYIFFEKGETITTPDGRIVDRIVRVGTHEKDDNLYKRLKQHFTGNIISSIFRKDIGEALSTDKETDKTYKEEEISKYMRENLSFVVFEVETEAERLYWEERIIFTLSKAVILGQISPSKKWLGNKFSKGKIRNSGLWLVQGLDKEGLTEDEFEKLKKLV